MKRSAAIIVLAVALGTLPACTPEATESPSPTPNVTTTSPPATPTPSDPPTTASSEPSPSPTPSETLDADQQAARDLVIEFYKVQDTLAMDSSATDLTPLMSITTGDAQVLAVEMILSYRENNLVHTDVVEVDVLSVREPVHDATGISVPVEVCTDASAVEIVDLDTGEAQTSDTRVPILIRTIDVVQENGLWLVSAWTSTPTGACP